MGAIRERAWFALRELTAASRRFDDFVRELARFNDLQGTAVRQRSKGRK